MRFAQFLCNEPREREKFPTNKQEGVTEVVCLTRTNYKIGKKLRRDFFSARKTVSK